MTSNNKKLEHKCGIDHNRPSINCLPEKAIKENLYISGSPRNGTTLKPQDFEDAKDSAREYHFENHLRDVTKLAHSKDTQEPWEKEFSQLMLDNNLVGLTPEDFKKDVYALKQFIRNLLNEKIREIQKARFPETGRGTKFGQGYNDGIDKAVEILKK